MASFLVRVRAVARFIDDVGGHDVGSRHECGVVDRGVLLATTSDGDSNLGVQRAGGGRVLAGVIEPEHKLAASTARAARSSGRRHHHV